jgi:hypothetical protein
MAAGPEVKTKLTLDDQASKQLDKIKSGFQQAGNAAQQAKAQTMGFVSQLAAVAIGVNIGNMFGSMKAGLMSAGEAAIEADKQFRALRTTVIGMSRTSGQSMDDFNLRTQSLNAQMERIARTAMVSRDELVQTFMEAGKNTSNTTDQLTNLISRVANASRALPAPIKDVVAGFEEVQKNMISAQSPIIAMVKQANLLRGHSEKIAQQMTWMGREGKIKMAYDALAILEKRAKAIPPSLQDINARFKDMKTDALRSVGEPMLKAFYPAVEALYKKITDGRGDIEKYARMIGEQAGEWITVAADKIQKGFEYLRTHADEIKTAIVGAFETAKTIFDGIVDNAKPLLALYAGMKLAPVAEGAMAAGSALASGAGLAGVASAVGPQAAFTAAIVASTMALTEFGRYLDDNAGFLIPSMGEAKKELDRQKRMMADYGSMMGHATVEEREAFDKLAKDAYENAAKIGESTGELGVFIDQMRRNRDALDTATKGMQEAFSLSSQIHEGLYATAEGTNQAAQLQIDAATKFKESFTAALDKHDEAALEGARKILDGATALQDVLVENGSAVGLSLKDLANSLGTGSDNLRNFRERLLAKAAREADSMGGRNQNNIFNGGQVFNIKQDFRDQDPDRVAVVFQRDISRAAENRLMARTVPAFGG